MTGFRFAAPLLMVALAIAAHSPARPLAAQVSAAPPRAAGPPLDVPAIDTLAIRGHTRFLADDLLLGRGTGTPGERIAAAYIVSQLKRLGLQPLPGSASFLHPIPLRAARVGETSSLLLQVGQDGRSFMHGRDFIVNTGGTGAFRDFRGRTLFLGQPVHAADLIAAERSLVGQVAVFLGPLGASALDIVPALSHAGAAGVIIMVPDADQYALYVRSRGETRYFVDAAVDDPVWQPDLPVLIAGPALSDALLDGIDIPPALLQGTATRGVDLGRSIVAVIHTSISTVEAANVAAMLPGSDPALSGEYVVYTAHYDHLGVSVPDATGDSIYSGFSDNAAGVAMLLAIAEALRDVPPARSLVFLFFTGEERGLLGSSYMAATQPVPLERIAGLINLDAGAPPAPPISWRIAGGDSSIGDSSIGQTAARVAARRGWTTTLSPASPNSDHWPFAQRGVPAIFIIPGDVWEDTTPEQRLALRERWDRYHQASDRWHADFPFAGLARYAEYALMVGLEIASDSPR
ncbi:M28 family metallopeptidase [soil metagenome]